jgi:hypothetical protein
MNNDQLILTSILEQKKQLTAPELSDADFFEYFCASEILKDNDLSYDEIFAGIVGKGNDGGIDSIYILLNSELVQEDSDFESLKRKKNHIAVHIIQAKRTNGFGEDPINKFSSTIRELFDLSRDLDTFKSIYNTDLLLIIQNFRNAYKGVITSFPDISFYFYYATLGNEVHPNTNRKVDQLKEEVTKHFHNAEFWFKFVGSRELLQLARREPTSNHELEFIENPISTENGSYVSLVPLRSYYKFITDTLTGNIKKSIFDANVRDYQGSVKVNRAIQETLQNPGNEDFWFLNNGVTIVCPNATASGKRILIEDPQIVNGLQTSYEIYNYFRDIKYEPNDDRKLLVRVIVEADKTSRDNIVRATNSQTSIPETSLRAADKIQRDIEDYLYHNDYYYERRKNYYKNSGKPISRIVSISYLSQAVISTLLQKPDYARARPSTLINKDEDYNLIFNKNYPIPIYLICVKLMKRIEDFLRLNGDVFALSRKDFNNIKFHVAMLVTMEVVNKTHNIKVEEIQTINSDNITDSMITLQATKVVDVYRNLGGTDQVGKGPTFVKQLIDGFSQKQTESHQ